MRIIHSVPSLNLEDGGPTRSVSGLAGALAEYGHDVHLVAWRDLEKEVLGIDHRIVNHSITRKDGVLGRLRGRQRFRAALSQAAGPEGRPLFHVSGVWVSHAHDTIMTASRLRAPVVLSPRGMLTPWALKYRAYRKRVAWALYQRSDLLKVTAFHATSHMEASDIRRLGFRQPIAVLPNGVNLPQVSAGMPVPSAPVRQALFLSRIHVKKGIELLVRAWAKVRPSGWQLLIAGNDECGYAQTVKQLIEKEHVGDSITYVGPAFGDAQDRLYRSSSLFLLPSYSENFGIVVAEALAYGLPVITTHGTPWSVLSTDGAGWHIPVSVESLAAALDEATRLSPAALAAMGQIGRGLVEQEYTWPGIAERMCLFYAALLEGDNAALARLNWVQMD